MAHAQTEEAWPVDLYDPGANAAPADLVLAMPCGASMAFQRVDVPVDAADPLADRRLLLGQSLDDSGYADYLHATFLRGAFDDLTTGTSFYYIARYELTHGQYRALGGDCAAPGRVDRLAKGDMSWFEAVSLSAIYSSWLIANAPDALPRQDGAPAYLRLPTEAEWEFAARGGARVDSNIFPSLMFYGDGALQDYALYQGAGSGRGNLGPIGLRNPNPLGLYDIYGNAEELMLEPFRLNAVGREHGQIGGIVTRGGSAQSTESQIYSAQRTEYPPFDAVTGAPIQAATFGLRLVLTTQIATSDSRLLDVQTRWRELAAGGDAAPEGDALTQLSILIAAETDPRRSVALSDLQHEFRLARDNTEIAMRQSANSALLAGAIFIETLTDNADSISVKASNIRTLVALQRAGANSANGNSLITSRITDHANQLQQLRRLQSTYLLSYRSMLDVLSRDVTDMTRDAAYRVLRADLGQSGQTEILTMLDRFWSDLTRYNAQPDMQAPALLELALD